MTSERTDSRASLRRLLDALDGHEPGRLQAVSDRPRQGPLFSVFEEHGLNDLDVALVLAALAGRLAGEPGKTGEDLSHALADDSATRLEVLGRLTGGAPIVVTGMLLPEVVPTHPAEAQSTNYRLGEHVFRLACEVFGQEPGTGTGLPTGLYRSNAELLGDLRRLSLHYRRRAVRIFHLDPWTGTGLEVLDGTEILTRRANEEADRIRERLCQTPDDCGFAALGVKERHGLQLDELVILATVLFQEVLEGVGAVDAVDLVKLVSESEAQLLENRELLRPLARAGLLRLEGSYVGKDLTADASLPNEVVDALLGDERPIDCDQQLDFHTYLQQLDSSDPFFTDMEGGAFGT